MNLENSQNKLFEIYNYLNEYLFKCERNIYSFCVIEAKCFTR